MKKWFWLFILSYEIYCVYSHKSSSTKKVTDTSTSTNDSTVTETIYKKILENYLEVFEKFPEEIIEKYTDNLMMVIKELRKFERKDPNINRRKDINTTYFKEYEKTIIGSNFINVLRNKLRKGEINETTYNEILESHVDFLKDKLSVLPKRKSTVPTVKYRNNKADIKKKYDDIVVRRIDTILNTIGLFRKRLHKNKKSKVRFKIVKGTPIKK